jgi:hypothetical protein
MRSYERRIAATNREETIHEMCPGNPGRSPCAVRLFYVSRASIRAPQALLGCLRPHGRLMKAAPCAK